jgi:hypothetical protein
MLLVRYVLRASKDVFMQMHPFSEKLEFKNFGIYDLFHTFCEFIQDSMPIFSLSWFLRVEESSAYQISP